MWLPTMLKSIRIRGALAFAALLAIATLVAGRFVDLPLDAEVAAVIVLLVVFASLARAPQVPDGASGDADAEETTDLVTGLPTRRDLLSDLAQAMARPPARGEQWLLVLFDLQGFQLYNETFGRPTGDALLARLGYHLKRSLPPGGRAYRLGGDEFSLLVECSIRQVETVIAGARDALLESGEGFDVSAACGSVLVPSEAATVREALQLADRRMYADMAGEGAAAGSESREVLLTALRARQPLLFDQTFDVDNLAIAVAEELGMSAEERDETWRAAQLREVGKISVPDAILTKPAPLEEPEWEFIRRSPVVGERIIASAPALVPVARLVRSVSERWDGGGYPDGLCAEQIPPGSRIVAVCAAYVAMISERPHSVAMRPARAIEELRRGSGSQFDPATVEAFERVAVNRGLVAKV
jgi:two-component system, cell cycle response regulator